MANKMLIDASHPEETRVVVTRGNRIEEFDFESQDKKQLRGNIYLARVTRVEPSLQAAFVEYGGNRHGFLAFSEIHPDYYQIPVADRQALLRAEEEAAEAEDEDNDDDEEQRGRNRRRKRGRGRAKASGGNDDAQASAAGEAENPAEIAEAVDADVVSEAVPAEAGDDNGQETNGDGDQNGDAGDVESVGADDALDEVQHRRKPVRRHYKIQEVIKRRQIMLVQVVKEERGNKGAALTTYLSLAGRYSVLMPNTARGGGISRKITSAQDRKRLKEVVRELEVPQGMGVILRTAGENRTKAEIKRDYEYLMRMWENVRNLTLESTAPNLVYEEGSLIKRSVRDLYNKDIDEILVAGDEGYREAKDFMRMLMPSHAKVVQPYRDNVPIFARNGIEGQLDRMVQPQVTLKSGGYIIINQTEALVAIDVNSGRSTREHSIEDTALQTNLEAADEVARQLRLRDLAGLIVIDFIDMEENRNNRAVEKRIKDCLKNDRARIQVGRISHFGLLEMSRQRIRASVLESTMKPCPHCGGTGHVRSDSSVALLVIRAIEEFLLKDARNHISVRTPVATALYILNNKRGMLVDLEQRFGLTITIEADDDVGGQHFAISRGAPAIRPEGMPEPPVIDLAPLDEDDSEDEADIEETAAQGDQSEAGDQSRDRKRRRRRRRRGGRDRQADAQHQGGDDDGASPADDTDSADEARAGSDEASDEDGGERRKRRRGKRGGRRNRQQDAAAEDAVREDAAETGSGQPAAEAEAETPAEVAEAAADMPEPASLAEPDEAAAEEPAAPAAEKPKRARASTKKSDKEAAPKRSRKKAAEPAEEAEPAVADGEAEAAGEPKAPKRPRRTTRKAAAAAAPVEAEEVAEPVAEPTVEPAAEPAVDPVVVSSGVEDAPADDDKPRRAGWWQRKSFF